jgi:hypothetical protein
MAAMTYGDERAQPKMFEATREALARLHAEIDQELASVHDRLADMRAHDEAARRIHQRAYEILGDLGRFAQPRG